MDSTSDTARAASTALWQLVGEFGPELALQPDRLGSLLRDECGHAKREIAVLIDAIRADVVSDLGKSATEPVPVLIAKLAQRLVEERGTAPELARWAVGAWVSALGLATPAREPAADQVVEPMPDVAPADTDRPGAVRSEPQSKPSSPSFWARYVEPQLDDPKRRLVLGAVAAAGVGFAVWQSASSNGGMESLEIAGTVFKGRGSGVAQIIGDGRDYKRVYTFKSSPDRPPKALILRWTDGTKFSNGDAERTVPLPPAAAVSGRFEEVFSYQGIVQSRRGDVRLVDADNRESDPVAFEYRAVPVPGTQAPKLLGIEYPRQFPANNARQRFSFSFEDADADVNHLEISVRVGDWKPGVHVIEGVGGQKQGRFAWEFWSNRVQKGSMLFRLIDARGNYSEWVSADFEATGASGPAAGGLVITQIEAPPIVAAASGKFKVKVFYTGGDVIRAEWFGGGDTPVGRTTFPPAESGKTYVSVTVEVDAPAIAGNYRYEVSVADVNGRAASRRAFAFRVQ